MTWSEQYIHRILQQGGIEYLCEIVLPESDLPPEARFICNQINASTMAQHPLRLTVFAVSVAYHDYDEAGFWSHFFDRVDLPFRQPTAEYVGSIVESCLKSRKFITGNREGSFRYVGPILEQSGITKRYLKRYVEILQEIARDLGWDGMRVIPFRSFQETMTSFTGSKFLIGFLKEKEGWEFTRGVARNYMQYQQGIIDKRELSALRGYHPDFWERLLAEIPEPPKRRRESLPPSPRFVFDPDYGQLALMFDGDFIKKRRYEMDGSLVTKSLLAIDRVDMVRESYRVLARGEQQRQVEYVVQGWNPKQVPEAFFALDRGYVPTASVGPGEYHFLAPIGRGIPAGIVARVTNELPPVSLPGEGPLYVALRVTVDDWPDSRLRQDPFTWTATATGLPGACDLYEAFVNCLPRVRIVRKDLFLSKTMVLLVDVGGGPRKVDVEKALRVGEDLTLPVSIPCKGTVWAEAVRRTQEFSGEDEIGRRHFCVVPSLKLEWPANLYGYGDEPEILLESDSNIRLQLREGARRIDDRRWMVHPGASLVEGELVAGPIRLTLGHRVHRARLSVLPEGNAGVVAVEQFDQAFRFEAAGIPGERAVIAIESGGMKLLGDVGRFGASGNLVFSSDMIRDAVKSVDFPIGRFMVVRNGQGAVPTSTWLINFEKFIDCTLGNSSPNWTIPEGLPSEIAQSMEHVREAIEEERFDVASFLEVVPRSRLGVLMVEAYESAAIFGRGVNINEAREIALACLDRFPEVNRTGLRWAIQARTCCEVEGNSEALLKSLADLSWRPAPKRWREIFNAIVDALKRDAELVPLFEEWLPEVKGPRRPGYRSRLGTMPSGNTLTDGWRAYRNGDFVIAYHKAVFASEGSRSPVRELAVLLAHVALFKTRRFGQGDEATFTVHKCLAYHLETARFIDILRARAVEISLHHRPASALPVSFLPLRDEDRTLFERKFLEKDHWKERAVGAVPGDDLDVALCAYFAWKEGERDIESRLRKMLEATGEVDFPPRSI